MEYDCGWRPRYTLNTQLHTTQQQRARRHTQSEQRCRPAHTTPYGACTAAQHAEAWSAAARRQSERCDTEWQTLFVWSNCVCTQITHVRLSRRRDCGLWRVKGDMPHLLLVAISRGVRQYASLI